MNVRVLEVELALAHPGEQNSPSSGQSTSEVVE
jgi:hypothetical protein